jgi:hypothetical protein
MNNELPTADNWSLTPDPWPLASTKHYVRNYKQNMQNKANFQKSQMNVSKVLTKDYVKNDTWWSGKNKAKTKPIQTQYKANTKPIQSQFKANSKPIQSQFKPKQSQFKPNTNPIQSQFKANSNPNKANSNPIKVNFSFQ